MRDLSRPCASSRQTTATRRPHGHGRPAGRAVEPNETLQIEIEWTARIPRAFARTGCIGDYYFIAQWFPKLGVLEDAGWNTHQFHAATEFYADFGVYDVRITVPDGYNVGATGRETRRMDNADGTTTHSYHGEDVARLRLDDEPRTSSSTARPSITRRCRRVEMRLLLRPEHRGQATATSRPPRPR